jgi:hypothetical protein
MSDSIKKMRHHIAIGGAILLVAGAVWWFLVSFGQR